MVYIIISLLLFALMLLYFNVADQFNIIDKPNERSAHTIPTLRGGGIIYWFTALIYFLMNFPELYLFFAGITIVSVVSFIDDIRSLPNRIRISAHFVAISLVFYSLNLYTIFPIWAVLIAYIFFIGIINAYNFMDGINGITGVYTIVVLSSLWYVNQVIEPFIDPDFILYPIIASLVFLYFNFRKKAKCFAGDVGSIAIAFWVIFLILKLILASNSYIWILFLTVYGTDTICTIIHRLYLRENIFKAHGWHFYQILCNQYKIDHRKIALSYAFLQFLISLTVIFSYQNIDSIYVILIIIVLMLSIYSTKFYLLKKHSKKINHGTTNN